MLAASLASPSSRPLRPVHPKGARPAPQGSVHAESRGSPQPGARAGARSTCSWVSTCGQASAQASAQAGRRRFGAGNQRAGNWRKHSLPANHACRAAAAAARAEAAPEARRKARPNGRNWAAAWREEVPQPVPVACLSLCSRHAEGLQACSSTAASAECLDAGLQGRQAPRAKEGHPAKAPAAAAAAATPAARRSAWAPARMRCCWWTSHRSGPRSTCATSCAIR